MNESFIFTAFVKEKCHLKVWDNQNVPNIHHDDRKVNSGRFLVKFQSVRVKSRWLFYLILQNASRLNKGSKGNRRTFINHVSKYAEIDCTNYEDDNFSDLVIVGDG